MWEQIDFTDDVLIVTSVASGIGRGVAEEFADEGTNVVIADSDEERSNGVADEISEEFDSDASVRFTDVSDHNACEGTVEDTVDAYGSVDGLVNVVAAASSTTSTRTSRSSRRHQRTGNHTSSSPSRTR